MNTNLSRVEPLTSENLEDLMYLYGKTRKHMLLWGGTLVFVFLFLALDVFFLIKYIKLIVSKEAIFPILIALLFIRIIVISNRYFSFFKKKNTLLKIDKEANIKNNISGVIDSFSFDSQHISLNIANEKVKLNFGAAFLGYRVENFSILKGQAVSVNYLPHSGLLFNIVLLEEAEKKIAEANETMQKVSGKITMIAIYKYALKNRWKQHSFYENRIQIGNTLLFWHKPEIPELGSIQEILVK